MRIGKTVLDLESLTEEDLTLVIDEAKNLRTRKRSARGFHDSLKATLENAKENKFSICSKYTGEILRAEDWVVYDDELECLHEGEWAF